MNKSTSVKYRIEDSQIHLEYQCEECGTILKTLNCSSVDNIQVIVRSYIMNHSRLHELALTGELTKKFITMVKDV